MIRFAQRWRAHPMRVHLSVILLLKLAALIAIYHYFFAPAQRVPVDSEHVAAQLLQPAVPPVNAR